MTDCVFCKIVAGEIPADRVYEDETTMAFLDISPNTKGHMLVIPKNHTTNVLEASAVQTAAVMATVQRITPAILKTVGSDAFNLFTNTGKTAGQVVLHWHVHLIPRFPDDGIHFWPEILYANGEAAKLAVQIKENIV